MEPESWWLPIWRFAARVLAIEAVLCVVCVALALWQGWGLDGLSAAIIAGGLALGAFGVLPFFLRTPTIRFGGSGYRGVMDMAAQNAADMLPGGQKSMLDDDIARANDATASGMLLIAVAAASLVVALVLSFL